MAKDNLNINNQDLGFGPVPSSPNLELGATLGAGMGTSSIDAFAPLVVPPATVIVLQAPLMYRSRPALQRLIKVLFETCATSWDGIDVEYSMGTESSPATHDGQEIEVPTLVTREPVSPSVDLPEFRGNVVWNVINRWMWDISHPDTNASQAFLDEPLPFVPSTYGMSIATIMWDQTGIPENIIGGNFITNMFPKTGGGGMGIGRQINQANQLTRSIQFSGHLRHTPRTKELLIELANALKLGRMRTAGNNAPIASDVATAIRDTGIAKTLDILDD